MEHLKTRVILAIISSSIAFLICYFGFYVLGMPPNPFFEIGGLTYEIPIPTPIIIIIATIFGALLVFFGFELQYLAMKAFESSEA